MHKEYITKRQAILILSMFIFGSSVVMGVDTESGQDSWISLIYTTLYVIPTFLIYARIMKLNPEKNLYEIIADCFGRFWGEIMMIPMAWYAIHLAALVTRNFSEFIDIFSMPETPQLPLMIGIILVTVYLSKSGVLTLGKWATVTLPVVLLVIVFTVLFSITHMDFDKILPVMEHDMGTISKSAYQMFSFPFAEAVLFLCIADAIPRENSPAGIFMFAFLITGISFLIITLRNIELLGAAMLKSEFYTSYIAARIITVGNFITRIEGSISMNFVLCGITKITLCLLAASKGAAKIFNMPNYKLILLPVSLLVLALSAIIYDSAMEMSDFTKIYKYYALPFQIVIPLMVWIASEIKYRKRDRVKTG